MTLPADAEPIPQSAGKTAIAFIRTLIDTKVPAATRVAKLTPLGTQELFDPSSAASSVRVVGSQSAGDTVTGSASLSFVSATEPDILLRVPVYGPDKAFMVEMQATDGQAWKVASFMDEETYNLDYPSSSPGS